MGNKEYVQCYMIYVFWIVDILFHSTTLNNTTMTYKFFRSELCESFQRWSGFLSCMMMGKGDFKNLQNLCDLFMDGPLLNKWYFSLCSVWGL